MPAPESSDRYQKGLLWRKGRNDRYGEPILSGPEEVKVRYEERQGRMIDPTGNTIALDGKLWPNDDLPLGSLFWPAEDQGCNSESALDQWYGVTGSGSAGNATKLYELMTVAKTPDVKGRFYTREYGMRYFRDTLPVVS